MGLKKRSISKLENFNIPVSYRIYEREKKFLDAKNVISLQNRLETRYGTSRYNRIALGGAIKSLSFFTKSTGDRYCIAKVGTELYSVSEAGTHTVIKSGLSASTAHRGVTDNDRHIIAIGPDGLFSWNGTTFTQLGQAAPTTLSAAAAAGGSLTSGSNYQGAITFYASSIGFETNYQSSSIVNVSGANLRLALTAIPATASNALIDKVRIYLKDVTANGEFLYIDEISLGTTTYNIDNESSSTETPPVNNGAPLGGGGKYLATFNSRIVYSGNASFPNDVFFSEEDLPDAFNPNGDQLTQVIKGQGGVTGLGVGLVGQDVHDPFLCIFKRKSTHVYTEIGGEPRLVTLSFEIGCVSHDTIQVKNGVVYFLSEEGWRAIQNGRFVTNESGEATTLGNGDIDDIFKTSGYVYEVNRSNVSGAFSVYYPTLDQYLTWVSEGTNNAYTKTYCYEFDIGGFKPLEFFNAATCATLGENSSGRDVVLYGTSTGYIIKHSIIEARSDVSYALADLRTNLLLYSEEIDNAYWTKTRSSVTSNVTVSPDSTLTADKLITDLTASNTHFIGRTASLTSGTTYTFSVFLKAAEYGFARVLLPGTGFTTSKSVFVNLSTGELSVPTSGSTASSEDVGNGWFRVSITATATATGTSGSFSVTIANGMTSGDVSISGDGVSGIYVWGFQLEQSSSVTDYIKSDSSAGIDGTEKPIDALAILPWMPLDGDFNSSYNFREFIIRAINSEAALSVKTFKSFDLSDMESFEYEFENPNSGFILDLSLLDEGIFGDERAIVTRKRDLFKVGECLAIGFYQSELDATMGLVSVQLDISKNGNRNQ